MVYAMNAKAIEMQINAKRRLRKILWMKKKWKMEDELKWWNSIVLVRLVQSPDMHLSSADSNKHSQFQKTSKQIKQKQK